MTEKTGSSREKDDILAHQFSQLRTEERASAPPFPANLEATATVSVANSKRELTRRKRQPMAHFVAIAATIAFVAIATDLLLMRPVDDPVALYTHIMQEQALQTDVLLQVSTGTLPELEAIPHLYEIEFALDPETFVN